MTQASPANLHQVFMRLDAIQATLNEIISGKSDKIALALACLLAKGHLLIEGLPGEGKTTLAQAIASAIGLEYQRIQFTNDLLPSDILGLSIYSREKETFTFHPGPVFSQLLLVDEVNRATPKTQSALLEAMAETQVTIEGKTHTLSNPFNVIATQNPTEQIGTYPLPESQLDRFLMRLQLGYASREAERAILTGEDRRSLISRLQPVVSVNDFVRLQAKVGAQFCSEALLDYLQDIVEFTRTSPLLTCGLSTRASQGLLHAAKAYSLLQHRDHVLPEDIQAVLPCVVDHRLAANVTNSPGQVQASETIHQQVAVS